MLKEGSGYKGFWREEVQVATNANQLVLGKYLNGRYKVVQVLTTGVSGQTYIAEDTWQKGSPKCVVKRFIPNSTYSQRWEIARCLFTSEVETLRKLGNHHQIPELLDYFEDHEGFYLLQAPIVGDPLSAELPTSKDSSKRWSEVQCVELLRDVLDILEFIHSRRVIHGNLKPNHLIRRTSDNKFVLIDFGLAHQVHQAQSQQQPSSIQPSTIPLMNHPLGYLPPEQLSGQVCPNGDLYALGMIAIQALTGLKPSQLQINSKTGEVSWQEQAGVSEAMGYVLSHMVLSDPNNRYQSATDVRNVLNMLRISNKERGVKKEDLPEPVVSGSPSVVGTPVTPPNAEPLDLRVYARELAIACWPKLPPLMTGVGAGVAASNALAISFGLYSLLHAAPSNPGLDLLARATEQYHSGNFDEAIALAQAIPTDSSAYQESLSAMQKWRQEWNAAAAQFKVIEQAAYEERWREVLEESRKIPKIAYWQQKIEPLVEQAKPEVEAESQQVLQQAYQLARQKDFTGALALLKEIPPETDTGAKLKPKLAEYSQKQKIKADYLLQQAYQRASERDFTSALKYLSEISPETTTYKTAQVKIVEYSQKQHFKEEVERQAILTANFPKEELKLTEVSQTRQSSTKGGNLNPGSRLQEVSPKPVLATPTRR